MAVTSQRRVGLRSPLQPVIFSAESWQRAPRNRIKQVFGRFTMQAVGEEEIIGSISIMLFPLTQRLTGDSNGDNTITQVLFPLRQHLTGAMEAFGSTQMNFGTIRHPYIAIDPRGYVSAQGPLAITLQKISFPRMDGVVGGVLMQSNMSLFGITQRADGYTNVFGSVALTFKGMQDIPGYGAFGGMLSGTVTPRADNTIIQTLFPIRQAAEGALLYNFGGIAQAMPTLEQRADGYTNVFGSSAMQFHGFRNLPSLQIMNAFGTEVLSGSIDGLLFRPISVHGSVLVVNDGAIQQVLFPPTQRLDGWSEPIGSISTLLFPLIESGNLAQAIRGTIAQTMPTLVVHVSGYTNVIGSAAQLFFHITQQAASNASTFSLLRDMAIYANLAKGEKVLTIAGYGLPDLNIGGALQGTLR